MVQQNLQRNGVCHRLRSENGVEKEKSPGRHKINQVALGIFRQMHKNQQRRRRNEKVYSNWVIDMFIVYTLRMQCQTI